MIFEFGNKAPYFLENIDATSLQGSFSADNLLGTVGQITTSKTYGNRTISCELAVVFNEPNMIMFKPEILQKIIVAFSPLIGGKLEVISDSGTYDIECYPSEIPKFDNSKIPYIYRFTVDFVCDFPYFRNIREQKASLVADKAIFLKSQSYVNTPLHIYIPDCSKGMILTNKTSGRSLKLIAFSGGPVTVDTGTYSVASAADGSDISNRIDLTSNMDGFGLVFGKNELISNVAIDISYHDYVIGVI